MMGEALEQIVVTADQMRQIEQRVFAAGMPVAALMEKAGYLLSQRIAVLLAQGQHCRIGVLVGPGHNGGDALVVARELHLQGYKVALYLPISPLKELTNQHLHYATALGIPCQHQLETWLDCDVFVDGLFGFGLERSLSGEVATVVQRLNQSRRPIFSIDLPSGIHTDTGQILGTAVQASHTFCLGLWKQGLLQDQALEAIGRAELVDIGLPMAEIQAVLADQPWLQRLTHPLAISYLPLQRPPSTHKYKMGHLLLICGSRRYAGGALLTGLGARASGVGMLSIAVPNSLKPLLTAELPEALVIGCAETPEGAIAHLPDSLALSDFQAIACGPGLTQEVVSVVETVLQSDCPLVLDADGLNILAHLGTIPTLQSRRAPTMLTPHTGEFKRLFPDLGDTLNCRVQAVRLAAQQTGAIVLLKGARVAVASPSGWVGLNPESTPALARGGSGDVLTGLIGGLVAQQFKSNDGKSHAEQLWETVQAAAWWHAQAGLLASQQRTVLGVDAFTLTQFLIPALQNHLDVLHIS